MEAATATVRRPTWLTGLIPVVVLAAAIGLFVALDAPGLDRIGVPQEELAVERTVLNPGEIVLHVRNDGADPVQIKQAIVNYEVLLLTSTGATIDQAIEAAVETPEADLGFYGLMALIGLYVGVIPVAIGMLWLPWLRTVDARWIRFLLAFTVGLLGFLAIEALLEGSELAGEGPEALGGGALVWLGAVGAYLALAGVDAWLRGRTRRVSDAEDASESEDSSDRLRSEAGSARRLGERAALLVALGIGLHNLGEGLAIGSAYAIGSLALGAALVVGFALHNTTEGLAIVAPVARSGKANVRTLMLLGLLAGAPAVLGAWIGASFFHPSVAAVIFGIGAGAIAQVIVQIAPAIRSDDGRLLNPLATSGLLVGLLVMYVTGLMVSV